MFSYPRPHVTFTHLHCKKVAHQDKISHKIYFKVSRVLKKMTEDNLPKNNVFEAPPKLPIDKALNI